MLAVFYLIVLGVLAFQLQSRVSLLASFRGLPRYLSSFGLTLFLVNWVNFLLYVGLGWGIVYKRVSWTILLLAVLYFSGIWKSTPAIASPGVNSSLRRLWPPRTWNYGFRFLAVVVLLRFYAGLDVDDETNVWSVFNFVDTAFHLSVVNAFLAAPHFPPMDLDMAPFPLKYHFLADFHVAHLTQLGLSALSAMWLMNVISAFVMVGTLWATFEQWLKLSARWVMLAGLIFLFLNTALLNVIHYVWLQPEFLDAGNLFYGLLRFPYFNFESTSSNMLEPQRGLLFSLPIILLVLHAIFDAGPRPDAEGTDRNRTLQAFGLICLLPLAHIVAFAVLAPCLVPRLWRQRRWFFSRAWMWLPVFIIGVLQLWYLGAYGPPVNADYSSWSSSTFLPLRDFTALPGFLRGIAFWFFADGDFLFWAGLFAVVAWVRQTGSDPARHGSRRVWLFLRQWRWYFVVCGLFFALINFYRYSFDWGDSNKPVFFFNLGLTWVIVLGAAQWVGSPRRYLSHALWIFLFILCIAPPTYSFYLNVLHEGHGAGTVLLFTKNGRAAAEWMAQKLPRREMVLTAAYDDFHFVTPLAGRPTLAGIYGDSNPYRQDGREEAIRRVYEEGEVELLPKLGVRYVCVSRSERNMYKLAPRWNRLMQDEAGVVFEAGEGPDDHNSVYVFDAKKLPSP
jgi:hypothetical protein